MELFQHLRNKWAEFYEFEASLIYRPNSQPCLQKRKKRKN